MATFLPLDRLTRNPSTRHTNPSPRTLQFLDCLRLSPRPGTSLGTERERRTLVERFARTALLPMQNLRMPGGRGHSSSEEEEESTMSATVSAAAASMRRSKKQSLNSNNDGGQTSSGNMAGNNGGSAPMSPRAKSRAQKEVDLQRLKDKAMKMKQEVIEKIDSQLQDMVEDVVNEVDQLDAATSLNGSAHLHSQGDTLSSFTQRRKRGELPDKEFIARKSVLTELLEISHIRTIYHIFVAILIVFSMQTIVYDFIDKGRIVIDFELIVWTFGQFPVVMSIWVSMTLATVLIVFPLFQHWAFNRIPGKVGVRDYIWLALYVIYQVSFLVGPIRVVVANELPPASAVIIVCEQVRLMMKAHAFVRENTPKVLRYDPKKTDEKENPCPNFSTYLYFLFAPTLVFRETYPRTPTIRWNYVVSNFGQVLACLFYTYYIFERFCVPVFRNFNKSHVTPRRLILSVFGSMLPGTLVLFIGFFAILHSWLNAFAEMLRFADRLFYKDWWNSSSFANYYRTWNVVVHDWLYSYVYKDCYKLFGGCNRTVSMAMVFLLSAVFHEYILSVAFGFFYPVLFLMFAGAGFAFIFLPSKAQRSGNVFMWVALFIGNGLLMCMYSMEWYARQSCPRAAETFVDYLIPRSWACDFSNMTTQKDDMDLFLTAPVS